MSAIYLIYNEGHTATAGDSLTPVDLSLEAIRLGRVLTDLMPDKPEAAGLLALMLLAPRLSALPRCARRASRPCRAARGSNRRLRPRHRADRQPRLTALPRTTAPTAADRT
jgi:hypothetical protein